ncbi:MAG: adenylosuccinate synthase [Oscillospiraceae bacterium]|nr:adenylosuccinate synthase [Oscillospiraceae bacterium]
MLTAITGINWGDEGKGRMVDLLSQDYDVVVRYQGGNNAGHTVVNEKGKFILNLLPSGILREEVVNVMGNGMVIDLEHLCGEMGRVREGGITITPAQLKISDKAVICMPYHKMQDCLEEDRLGDAKYGSTRRGIAPVYGDKYMKKAIRMGELLEMDKLKERLKGIVEWKSLTFTGVYGAEPISFDEMVQWLETYGGQLKDYICDTSIFLNEAQKAGKKILFEAQLGALRDIDFGIYPYTSSSSTIGAYAPIGSGIPNHKLDLSIGVMKAYSTCVGEGPFTCEMFGEEAENLRKAGGEYGAATGRPRRVGPFDVPASRYGVRMQGADEIALTKMDVLSGFEQLPVCVAYEVDGVKTTEFPTGAALDRAKPVVEYVPGWNCDITKCRKWEDLPKAAQDYILYLEKAVECKIKYVSVGAEREEYLVR